MLRRVLSIAFLISAALVLLLALIGWAGTFWADGTGPYYWIMVVMGVAPLIGSVILLISIGIFAWNRKFIRWNVFAFVAGLVAVAPLLWTLIFEPIPYPSSLSKSKPAVTVNWPLDQQGRVAWGGDSFRENYHVMAPDQRWAYDIVIEPAFTGSKKFEDYGCFGKPILAPAKGEVVVASDGSNDMSPTTNLPLNIRYPLGNYIAVKLDDTKTYLLIAHLKKGSLKVKPGDRIKPGDVIAACGNSGNTSEPHVHIHHQRQSPAERPLNLAEGLPLYFASADGPKMPHGGFSSEGKPIGEFMRPYDEN